LREETLYGFDFDTTMVRIGAMNLLLHGIEHPNLKYADTLSKRFDEKDEYQVVLTNPPFKGSIDKGDIHEELSLKTTKTELLFVNRVMNLLRIGGRAGVIVPDGVLFGSSNAHKALRKMLLEECELQAVVSMPSGVFKPYAGVSTAVIVFVKGGKTERVWFYDMDADGYSLDDKREKIEANDIPDIVAKWREWNHGQGDAPDQFADRKQKAFYVPVEEIVGNGYDLSLNRYKETAYEEVQYDPPKVILQRLRELEDEIRKDLDDLERML
jgi:type I restriction enzyme M protein